MRFLIAPSLLSADMGRLTDEVKQIEAEGADLHHVDVMDGHFVPNITFGPDIVKAIKAAATLPLDVHLMIDEPERYAAAFVKAGADIITFHPEIVDDPRAFCLRLRAMGAKAGASIRPRTPLEMVDPYLDALDMVMIMTVHPGFGGQEMIADCLPKIAAFRRRVGPEFDVEVDGGVHRDTVRAVAEAGANVIVSGSGIFGRPDRRAAIAELRAACERYSPYGAGRTSPNPSEG